MDLLVGHVKWLGTLETRAFWTGSSVEASMEEQAAGGASKAWAIVRRVGRSPASNLVQQCRKSMTRRLP